MTKEHEENAPIQEDAQEQTHFSPEAEPTLESVVEAVLFTSDEPLSPNRLSDIVGTSVKQIRQHIKNLNDKYQANNNAFRIEEIAGGYQMLTLSSYNPWLKKLRLLCHG